MDTCDLTAKDPNDRICVRLMAHVAVGGATLFSDRRSANGIARYVIRPPGGVGGGWP